MLKPTVIHGDCLEALLGLGANTIDSLVTDPPAGISFMGKGWDGNKGGRDQWVAWLTEVMAECLRVLKPGAHALVWAIPRTSHWTMTALEDAGFEIRDVVTHLFGTGFPKSLDVSKAIDKEAGAERPIIGPSARHGGGNSQIMKGDYNPPRTGAATDSARQWEGFGTALKPACEFWILCRKPISEKTVAKNVLKWGTGAINVDACRIDSGERPLRVKDGTLCNSEWPGAGGKSGMAQGNTSQGRFPSNLILDEEAAAALDEQGGERKVAPRGRPSAGGDSDSDKYGSGKTNGTTSYADQGGASRFFYVAKASKTDRGEDNTHPTVKSTKLMAYLVRLITPPGGIVLDPFMGSGSTGVAAKAEGMKFIGIEQDCHYVETARKRLAC